MPIRLARKIMLLVAVLFISEAVWAQSATTLIGSVTDPQGAVVVSARINIYPQGTSTPIRTQSNAEGNYRAVLAAGGTFVVEVEVEGFRNASRVVSIANGQESREDLLLEIDGVAETVFVTASAEAQTVDQISKAVSVVDAPEIANRNEYALSSVLSTLPGVQLRSSGGPGQATSISIRGLPVAATGVLIDGLRFRDVANPQTSAANFISTMNFVAADRVELLRGSGSSLYGSNSAGGVVNIVTDEGGGRVHGTLQAEGGTLGLGRGRGQIGGGLFNDRFKYSFGLLHLNVSRGVDGNDANRSTGGQAHLRYDITPQTSVSGRFYGSDDFVQTNSTPRTAGIPAANLPAGALFYNAVPLPTDQVERLARREPADYGNATYVPNVDDPDNRRTYQFQSWALRFQHRFSPLASFHASYQKLDTIRVLENGPAGIGFQNPVPNYQFFAGLTDTLDAKTNIQFGPWSQLTLGYEFEREAYDDFLDNNNPNPVSRIRTATSAQQKSNAAYFQDQISLFSNRLQISLSGRSQFFRLSPPRFDVAGISNVYANIPLVSPPEALTGDAAVSYFIQGSGTKLRVHGGNAYRAPGLYERFGAFFTTNAQTGVIALNAIGDPDLGQDRYNSVDGGIDQYLFRDRVRLSATYFYSRMVTLTAYDSANSVIKVGADRWGRTQGYINGSGGISRGLELGVESRPTASLTVSGAYTYARANTDRDLQFRGFFRTFGTPRHTYSVVAMQRIGQHVNLALDIAGNSDILSPFIGARPFRFPRFTKTDVSASYVLKPTDGGGVRLYTRIENIFNRTIYDQGNLLPKASVVSGLSYQF